MRGPGLSTSAPGDGGSALLALTALIILAGGIALSAVGALGAGPSATGDFVNPDGTPTTIALPAPERVMGDSGVLRGVTVAPPWHDTSAVGEGRWVVPRSGATFGRDARPERVAVGGRWALVRLAGGESTAALGFNMLEAVSGATASIVAADGSERACSAARFGRVFCGPDAWNWVGATTVRVRDRDERCLWAHPTAEGVLRIRFDGVPGGTTLRGRYAMSDAAAERADAGRVQFRVFASRDAERRPDEEPLLDRMVSSRRGFSAYRVELRDPGIYRVDVEVSADDVGMRHFCFDGQTRPAAAGSRGSTGDGDEPGDAASQEGSATTEVTGSGIRSGRRNGLATVPLRPRRSDSAAVTEGSATTTLSDIAESQNGSSAPTEEGP